MRWIKDFVFRIYDVQDIKLSIPDFPGPEMDVAAGYGGSSGGAVPVFGSGNSAHVWSGQIRNYLAGLNREGDTFAPKARRRRRSPGTRPSSTRMWSSPTSARCGCATR
jgi:hypothetical protein